MYDIEYLPNAHCGTGLGVNMPVAYVHLYTEAGVNSKSTPCGQLIEQLILSASPEQL